MQAYRDGLPVPIKRVPQIGAAALATWAQEWFNRAPNQMSSAFLNFYRSSVGKKILVALTGMILVGFVLGHMIGNLLIYLGPHALNEYALFLKSFLHGGGIWVARIVLLSAVLIHIVATIQLARSNRGAREKKYVRTKRQNSTSASRFMIISGLTILTFIIFHVLQFTVGAGNDYHEMHTAEGHHDVYAMVTTAFKNPAVSIFYLIAIGLLCWHLSHGVASMLQTLGLTTPSNAALFKKLALVFAILIFIGNASIPLSIYFDWLPELEQAIESHGQSAH